MRTASLLALGAAVLAGATPARAEPEAVGLTQTGALVPDHGFLDDVTATDGKRLVVVITDGAKQNEVRVLDADGAEKARIDVAKLTSQVRHVYLLDGDRLFVSGDTAKGDAVAGTLVGFDGKVVKKYKAATDLFVRSVGGKDTVISYTRAKQGRFTIVHKVQAVDLAKGTPIAKQGGQLKVGADGSDPKLDFKPIYFTDDMTVAVGTKGGVWRKEENQRSPDTFASYDLLGGAWIHDEPITDLVAHTHRLYVLGAVTDAKLFARVNDQNQLELWRDGTPTPITLDQPLEVYDPTSASVAMKGDKVWIAMQVDPVNLPAVKRRKADPEYLDLFELDGAKAVRKARVFAPKKKLRWGWAGDTLWVMEKNVGFDRGSKALTMYKLGGGVVASEGLR